MSISSESNTDNLPEEAPPLEEAPNADVDDDELFAHNAILYRFSREKNEWVTRGCGILKILRSKDSGHCRVLMRQNQTYVVRANHMVPYLGTLHTLHGTNREFSWTAFDFTDTKEPDTRELFAVRFELPGIANDFKKAFENSQETNKQLATN